MRPIIGINLDVAEADGRSRLSLPAEYVDAVVESGGRPRLVAALDDERLLRDEVEGVDAFLFIGGADYPSSSYGEPPHEKANPMSRRRAASMPADMTCPRGGLGAHNHSALSAPCHRACAA